MRRIAYLVLAACGSSSPAAPARPVPPPDPFLVTHEHWETIETQRFANADKCGMGPFEVSMPDRDDSDPRFTYGRRMVLLIYGPRRLAVDNRVDSKVVQTGINMTGNEEVEAEHLECRVGAPGDVPVATATAPAVTVPVVTPRIKKGKTPSPPPPAPEKHWYTALNTPSDKLPQLVPYTGEMRPKPRQGGAIAFFPKGDPYYYAMERELVVQNVNDVKATARVNLRFWMQKPSNLEGVVFEVLEQRLVPDQDTPAYAAQFAERVARVKQRQQAELPANRKKWEAEAKHCKDEPTAADCSPSRVSMRIPPAPLAEVRPKQPKGDVTWMPGYWNWDDALDDFFWISGTYIVRPPPKPPELVAVAPPPPPVVVEPPRETPREIPREIDAKIAEPPPPKVEELPPPPPGPQPNTVWVAGRWELLGSAWRWTTGAWIVAPVGTRYRAPVVHRRGTIRIYVPGGWRR